MWKLDASRVVPAGESNDVIKENTEHLKAMQSLHQQAMKEWLCFLRRHMQTIFTAALADIQQDAFTFKHGDSGGITCNVWSHTWAGCSQQVKNNCSRCKFDASRVLLAGETEHTTGM